MVLEIDNVELNFDSKRILSGIYLRAKSGEVTGILGRNGSGKTSLFKILFGCLKPKYKNIRINGTPYLNSLFLTDKVGYLPQHNLLTSRTRIGKAFKLFNVRWDSFTDNFPNFNAYKDYKVGELSSGEVRALETYLILHVDKSIILLDEPFSFVAPIYVEKFKKIILQKKKERIIVITDHFYRDILEISDCVYLLHQGFSKLIQSQEELKAYGYLN